MLLRRSIGVILLSFICFSLFSQEKILTAIKATEKPKIDAKLDDLAWKDVPSATNFIQNFPNVGKPASQRTEVKVVYDDDAIYVAAYLYDDPSLIRRQITARDDEQLKDLDYFSVFFDTYHDQQNGFQFLVTSSNVQTDARLSASIATGFGQYGDISWDAVWDSKVSIQKDGWIVEMKIPYISLRFSKKQVQDWGIQFLRSVRRTNETSFWRPVDPQVNGFVNQFGLLKNLVDIKPPLRLSFSPYLSTGVRSTPDKDGYRNELLGSGGMDVKYGLNESFTLDATLIPDFGQVVSDNVVNNLTPYEVKFDENRPFFTEGTEIFNKSGLFYSRRIGATPGGYNAVKALANADPNINIVKNPARTNLYNAIKFSGRTNNKLGIGIFNAIGSPMYAVIHDKTTGDRTKIQTEPLTNYNIIVLDQAFKGRSYVTFTNTNVLRNGANNDANVTGLDVNLYDRTNTFNVKATGQYSKIFAQSSYDGYASTVEMGKVSGKLRYSLENIIRSVDFDPTDLGYLQNANLHQNEASISYNDYTPGKTFLNQVYRLTGSYKRLYKPNKFAELQIEASSFWYFKNFWDVSLSAGYLADQHDYFVIGRPFDKYARRPQYGFAGLSGSSDSRKKLFFRYELLKTFFFKNKEKDNYLLSGGLRYRFNNKLTVEISNSFETETDYIVSAGRTLMDEPRIAFVDFKDVTSVLSGIYNFTSRINLTLRARHYWSNVIVKRLALLDNNGNAVAATTASGLDYNVNYFNADAFFTWDFRYGSRLILGYKNWLGENETIDGTRYRKYIPNLGESFKMRHGNELTVRFIYFLDYNQLRKKK